MQATQLSPSATEADLRGFIYEVATTFDRAAPMGASAQQLLRRAFFELDALAPVGFRVVGSGGAGVPAVIPWFAFLDPDETTTPQNGLYVVYLFAADLATVSLTLIQGITRLHQTLRPAAVARARLRDDGGRIRDALGATRLAGYETVIDLKASARLPAGYEAGAVVAVSV